MDACRWRRAGGGAAPRLGATREPPQRVVGPHELGDLDTLVRLVRVARRAGPEIDRAGPRLGELCNRRPRLLRPHIESAGALEPADERPVDDDVRRGRVPEDLDRRLAGEPSYAGLGVLARTAGCIADVDPNRAAVGDDVVGDPAADRDRTYDLAEHEPVDLDLD